MTVYVDEMFAARPPGSRKSMTCHMWSDSGDEELLAFAAKIGLKPESLQTTDPRFHHFHLPYRKHAMALRRGAEFMLLSDWIRQQRQTGPG